jgi:hypothetical protein
MSTLMKQRNKKDESLLGQKFNKRKSIRRNHLDDCTYVDETANSFSCIILSVLVELLGVMRLH